MTQCRWACTKGGCLISRGPICSGPVTTHLQISLVSFYIFLWYFCFFFLVWHLLFIKIEKLTTEVSLINHALYQCQMPTTHSQTTLISPHFTSLPPQLHLSTTTTNLTFSLHSTSPTEDEPLCELQGIASLFRVSCMGAIILLNVFIITPPIIFMLLYICYIKRRWPFFIFIIIIIIIVLIIFIITPHVTPGTKVEWRSWETSCQSAWGRSGRQRLRISPSTGFLVCIISFLFFILFISFHVCFYNSSFFLCFCFL